MKPKTSVPIPPHLEDAPKDARGWPITFTSILMPDGRYDFTTTDPYKWKKVVNDGLCASCGKPLDRDIYFIGGPKTMRYHLFFDAGMHEDCARYSLMVCPYLSMPKYFEAKKRLVPELMRKELVSADKRKPEVFGLAMTHAYRPVIFQGDLLVQAAEWKQPIEWWKDGKRCEPETVEGS